MSVAVLLIEALEQSSPCFGQGLGNLLTGFQIQQGRAFGAEPSPLVYRRQVTRLPVLDAVYRELFRIVENSRKRADS